MSISQSQVSEVCDLLVSQGADTTLSAVRVALGGVGSYSTIAKFVKVWRDSASPAPAPVLPDSIRDQAIKFGATVYLEAQKIANEQLNVQRLAFESKFFELETANDEAYKTLDIRESEIKKLGLELLALKEQNNSLNAELDRITSVRMDDIAKLNDALGQVSALRKVVETFGTPPSPAPAPAPARPRPAKKDTKTKPLDV